MKKLICILLGLIVGAGLMYFFYADVRGVIEPEQKQEEPETVAALSGVRTAAPTALSAETPAKYLAVKADGTAVAYFAYEFGYYGGSSGRYVYFSEASTDGAHALTADNVFYNGAPVLESGAIVHPTVKAGYIGFAWTSASFYEGDIPARFALLAVSNTLESQPVKSVAVGDLTVSFPYTFGSDSGDTLFSVRKLSFDDLFYVFQHYIMLGENLLQSAEGVTVTDSDGWLTFRLPYALHISTADNISIRGADSADSVHSLTFKFIDGNGQEIRQVVACAENGEPAPPATPDYIAGDVLKGFIGWSPALPAAVTASGTYTAGYSDKAYRVTYSYKAADGSDAISEQWVNVGEYPERPETPNYIAGIHEYKFEGWGFDLRPIHSPQEYTASYTEVFYPVSFTVNGETSVEMFAYGEIPDKTVGTFVTEKGVRHTFSRWSPALAPAHEGGSYTAVFNTKQLYRVTFRVYALGAEEMSEAGAWYDVGEEVTPVQHPEGFMYGNGYARKFLAWDKEVSLTAKAEDVTYTATYETWVRVTAFVSGISELDAYLADFYKEEEYLPRYIFTGRGGTSADALLAYYEVNGAMYIPDNKIPIVWDKPGEIKMYFDVGYRVRFESGTDKYKIQPYKGYYRAGEVPEVPEVKDFKDGINKYRFVGWDKPVGPVTGTVVYTAQWEKTNPFSSIGGFFKDAGSTVGGWVKDAGSTVGGWFKGGIDSLSDMRGAITDTILGKKGEDGERQGGLLGSVSGIIDGVGGALSGSWLWIVLIVAAVGLVVLFVARK